MIFAKVDVDLLTHQRLLDIPRRMRREALGLWLSALLYTRGKELDGFCPMNAIDVIPGDKVLGELVRVGLLSTEKKDGVHGVFVLRYADFNETKAEIDARRAYDRSRKGSRPRKPTPPEPEGNPNGFRSESNRRPGDFPDSDSHSGSGSQIGEGDLQGSTERPSDTGLRVRSLPERYIEPTDPITSELREAAKMATVQDVDGAWLKFTGKYAGQWRHVAGAWQAFCVSWAKVERTERERERDRAAAAGKTLTAEGLDPSSFEASQARKARDRKQHEADAARIAAQYQAKESSK